MSVGKISCWKTTFELKTDLGPVEYIIQHYTTPQAIIEKWMREGGVWDHRDEKSYFNPWHSIKLVEVVESVKCETEEAGTE